MNKTKQEMLVFVNELDKWMNAVYAPRHQHQNLEALRTLITDSVILSDGEIEGMWNTLLKPDYDDFRVGANTMLEKIKEMK